MFLAQPVAADGVVALRTIPARAILAEADVELRPGPIPGAAERVSDVVGREARTTIFAGRPVGPGDLAEPALIERNALVTLVYRTPGLTIEAVGRSMSRAAAGDTIRVLNTGSRIIVTGQVATDGTVNVALN
jgi:flagella basal body P-ring formation protein FlgA